jgi:hypothetical protein
VISVKLFDFKTNVEIEIRIEFGGYRDWFWFDGVGRKKEAVCERAMMTQTSSNKHHKPRIHQRNARYKHHKNPNTRPIIRALRR